MSSEEEVTILSKPQSQQNGSFSSESTEHSMDEHIVNIPQLDIEGQSRHLSYGKLMTFYYVDNEPTFAIGPDWPYFACMFTLNICLIIFLMSMIWAQSYTAVLLLGMALSIAELAAYLLTAIINPGLPKSNYEELAFGKKEEGSYRKCKECNLWISCKSKTYHCYDCGVCFEGYDHHCPWTTKCVAGGNVKYFYAFLIATFVLFSYFVFAVVMMTVYISNQRKS